MYYLWTEEIPNEKKLYKAVLEDLKYPVFTFMLKGHILYKKTNTRYTLYLYLIVWCLYLEYIYKTYDYFGWLVLEGALKNQA